MRYRKYKFIDLFCGVGGIRMGFSRAGFKCVFSCDINEDCRKTYNENYENAFWGYL